MDDLDLPAVPEVCEPSPIITTAGSRVPAVAAVFLAALEEVSAASLRFFDGLFATSTSPEVMRSESLVTAKSEAESVRIQGEGTRKEKWKSTGYMKPSGDQDGVIRAD